MEKNKNLRRSISCNAEAEKENKIEMSSTINNSFCRVNNFSSSIVYLSQEIQNLGLCHKLIESEGGKLNLLSLVNACWELIQMYHNAIRDSNDLHDYRRKDITDINVLQGNIKDIKMSLEEKERLLNDAVEKSRQANSIQKNLSNKLKTEKDEVRRLSNFIQQREAQHQHLLRKKEAEMNKLQERLQRLVNKGTEVRMSSLSTTGSLNRSDKARGKWRNDHTSLRHEEELYRKVLSQYESWVSQLTDEGDQLKECLASLSSKIAILTSICADNQDNLIAAEQVLKGTACDHLIGYEDSSKNQQPMFSLNFGTVRSEVQKQLDANLEIISSTLNKMNEKQKKDDFIHTNFYDLDNEKEETLLDESLINQIDFLTESQHVEREQELKERIRILNEERIKLKKEREIFTMAAIKLNKEKASFEVEKGELLRQQFLSDFPDSLLDKSKQLVTPKNLQNLSNLYGDSPRTLVSIPCLTSPTGNVIHQSIVLTPLSNNASRQHRYCQEGSRVLVRNLRSFSSNRNSVPNSQNSSLSRYNKSTTVHRQPRSTSNPRGNNEINSHRAPSRISGHPSRLSESPSRMSGHSSRTFESPSRRFANPSRMFASPSRMNISSCFEDSSQRRPILDQTFPLPHSERKCKRVLSDYYGREPPLSSSKPRHFQSLDFSSLGTDNYSKDSGFWNGKTDSKEDDPRVEVLENSLDVLISRIKKENDTKQYEYGHLTNDINLINRKAALEKEQTLVDSIPHRGEENLYSFRDFNPPSFSTAMASLETSSEHRSSGITLDCDLTHEDQQHISVTNENCLPNSEDA